MSIATQTRAFEDVTVGAEVPPFSVPLTAQRMVMECAVNRDFAPIHHDSAIAKSQGAPDMFVNTLFLLSVYEATLRQWAGLSARISKVKFKMVKFNCVGEVVTCRAVVRDKIHDADGDRAVLEVWTETGNGVTTSGQAVVTFSNPS